MRRWATFKRNRRAFVSLALLGVVFAASLAAELLANERPLLVRFRGAFYSPALKSYPETLFGGDLPIEADFKDGTLADAVGRDGWILWAPDPNGPSSKARGLEHAPPTAPDRRNWFGTDDQGRDVFARLLYAVRLSLLFGLLLALATTVIGIVVGAVQGYFGGKLDLVVQRVIEIWGNLPSLYVLIIFSSLFTPGFLTLLLILVAVGWSALVGLVRLEFLKARNHEYVRAARALGVPDLKIMFRHLLPNAMVSILTNLPFIVSGSIASLTALDFLGLGLPPGSPSLGELLEQGKNNLQAPWLGLIGFAATGVLLSLFIFVGEGLRDAFDPRGGGR